MVDDWRKVFFGAACAGALGSAACAVTTRQTAVPTIPLLQTVNEAERLQGQVIRTCGTHFRRAFQNSRIWELVTPKAVGWHPARIQVLPCGSNDPVPDSQNCITGQIARFDGSSRKRIPSDPIIVADPGNNPEWFLHAQCPSTRR
jgi:hypothetical protein